MDLWHSAFWVHSHEHIKVLRREPGQTIYMLNRSILERINIINLQCQKDASKVASQSWYISHSFQSESSQPGSLFRKCTMNTEGGNGPY